MTTTAHDQQLVPMIIFSKTVEPPIFVQQVHTFILQYCQETPQSSVSSRFLICIFYNIARKPPRKFENLKYLIFAVTKQMFLHTSYALSLTVFEMTNFQSSNGNAKL